MDNFATILNICRYATRGNSQAGRREVSKLAKALSKSGSEREAKQLQALLADLDSDDSLNARSLVFSSIRSVEEITHATTAPFDRESGIPLATIHHPSEVNEQILFDKSLEDILGNVIREQHHAPELAELGVRPTTSILLFGEPGTGKTTTAFEVASRMRMPVINASLSGLTSSFLGTTSRNLNALFSFANRYRCVLLLDEFDAIAKVRDDSHELGEIKRVVNTLLQCLDERRELGITIAITNHDHLLDSAVWRRFDLVLRIPLPSAAIRTELIGKFLRPLTVSDVEKTALSILTERFSGSDIENLCSYIKRRSAITNDNQSTLETSLEYMAKRGSNPGDDPPLRHMEKPALARWLYKRPEGGGSFNQRELSELFKVSQATISRWLAEEISNA